MLNTKSIKVIKTNSITDIKENEIISDDLKKTIAHNITQDTRSYLDLIKQNEINKILNEINNNNQPHLELIKLPEIVNLKNDRIIWHEASNSYIIYIDNNIDCIITNDDIIQTICSPEINNIKIQKYLFTVKDDDIDDKICKFNVVNSILTDDFDIIIKIQNFLYDTINSFILNNISDDNFNNILLFYYQFIIFIFKNNIKYELVNDINKISKFYSTLSYRFSCLILKSIIRMQNSLDNNNNLLLKLSNIKNELINKMEIIISNINNNNNSNINNNDDNSNDNDDNSNDDDNSNSNDNITSKQSSIDKSLQSNVKYSNSSIDIINKYKLKNKDGNIIKNIDEIFSDEEINLNNYKEIENNKYSNKFSKITDIETNNQLFSSDNSDDILSEKKPTQKVSKITSSYLKSYNIDSPLNNSKVYHIKI